MTSSLRLTRDPSGGFRLETKRTKRVAYLLVAALLGAAMALGWDPEKDLAPERAPWTALYVLVMAGTLAGALSHRVVTAREEPRELCVERRIAGVTVRREVHPVPPGAVVRLRTGHRPRFVLEFGSDQELYMIDGSSWKSELEPMGKALAHALGVSYEGVSPP